VTRPFASGIALICLCVFLSGATALIYEVVWLRMLGVFGHTVYAVTAYWPPFMAGLGLGSFLLGRRAASLRDFSFLQFVLVFAILLILTTLMGGTPT
jgi:spermidine synthase